MVGCLILPAVEGARFTRVSDGWPKYSPQTPYCNMAPIPGWRRQHDKYRTVRGAKKQVEPHELDTALDETYCARMWLEMEIFSRVVKR